MQQSEWQENVGLQYRVARIRLGLRLYQVAKEVNITPARLSQFEGGHRSIPPEIEAKLRAVLRLGDEDSADGKG